MKIRKWLALAVLLAVPALAWAQVVVNDGSSVRGQTGTVVVGGLDKSTDTTGRAISVNTSGHLRVVESDPAESEVSYTTLIAVDSLRAAGDSSGVISLGRKAHLYLAIKGCPKGPHGQAFTNVAVQFRLHINGQTDSSNTVPIYVTQQSNVGIAVTAASDTVHTGHLAAGTANVPWSGEVVVRLDRARCGPDGSASSTLFYPGGIAIPLDGLFGREVRLPNVSVRFRVIGGPSVLNFTATLVAVGK